MNGYWIAMAVVALMLGSLVWRVVTTDADGDHSTMSSVRIDPSIAGELALPLHREPLDDTSLAPRAETIEIKAQESTGS